MPNVATVLKAEISRIARKEAKAAAGRVHRPAARLRKGLAELRARIALLEQDARRLRALLSKAPAAAAPADAAEAPRARVTAKGIRSLRRRLGLSRAEFAALVKVSDQAVYNWEKANGALKVRSTTRAAILAVRDIGAKEARAQLVAEASQAKAPRKRARGKR